MAKQDAIGALLVRAGFIDAPALSRAREAQEKHGISLIKALVRLGLADEQGIVSAIAKTLKLDCLGPDLPSVSPEIAALLPADFCRKRAVVP